MSSESGTQTTVSNTSGGVDVNAQGNSSVGGDIVGRDKFIVNNIHVHVQPDGKTGLLGEFVKLPMSNDIPPKSSNKPSSGPKKKYRRERIYKLDLRGDDQQIRDNLSRWRMVYASAIQPSANQPIAVVANEIVGIGQRGVTTFCSAPVSEMSNCSVQCKLRIIDDGGDPSNWAGIRLRGWLDDIRFGYLIYLRRRGSVELYRTQQVLAGLNNDIIHDTTNAWTRLRVDIFNSRIQVWVNDKLHIDEKDAKLRDKGLVYLHTLGTHAQFRDFEIHRLVRT